MPGALNEAFVQTLYDMEHIEPSIYRWTNVLSPELAKRITDGDLKDFYDGRIRPILRKIKNNATKDDVRELAGELNKVPEIEPYNLSLLVNP